jgi:hypothetical protein
VTEWRQAKSAFSPVFMRVRACTLRRRASTVPRAYTWYTKFPKYNPACVAQPGSPRPDTRLGRRDSKGRCPSSVGWAASTSPATSGRTPRTRPLARNMGPVNPLRSRLGPHVPLIPLSASTAPSAPLHARTSLLDRLIGAVSEGLPESDLPIAERRVSWKSLTAFEMQ